MNSFLKNKVFIQLFNLADTKSSSVWERMARFRMAYNKLNCLKASGLQRQEGQFVLPKGMQYHVLEVSRKATTAREISK